MVAARDSGAREFGMIHTVVAAGDSGAQKLGGLFNTISSSRFQESRNLGLFSPVEVEKIRNQGCFFIDCGSREGLATQGFLKSIKHVVAAGVLIVYRSSIVS